MVRSDGLERQERREGETRFFEPMGKSEGSIDLARLPKSESVALSWISTASSSAGEHRGFMGDAQRAPEKTIGDTVSAASCSPYL